MQHLKWAIAAIAIGFLGKLLGGPIHEGGAFLFRWFDYQLGYKFDRPINSLAEFQSAVYLRGVMLNSHCPALGFDLDGQRFFDATERLGFGRDQALKVTSIDRVHNSVERVLPRNPSSGDVPCIAMFRLLDAAVPGAVRNTRPQQTGGPSSAQPVPPKPNVNAAKNIYLVLTSIKHCPLLMPDKRRVLAYLQENRIELAAIKDQSDASPYAAERQYAEWIARSHANEAGEESLCSALLRDFGPGGQLAAGLIEHNLFNDLVPTEKKAPF